MTSTSELDQPPSSIEDHSGNLLANFPELEKNFQVLNKIGEGTFSCVYLAKLKEENAENSRKVALKCIVPTSHPIRIENELHCLQTLRGENNVIGLLFSFRHNDHTVFGMPYFPHDKFINYFELMSVEEVQLYMKNLLLALNHVHSNNLIHRDVKPSNFLYDRQQKRFALVDFGLSQKTNIVWTPIQRHSNNAQVLQDKKNTDKKCGSLPTGKRKLEDLDPDNTQKLPPFRSPFKKRITLGVLSSNDLNIQNNKSSDIVSKNSNGNSQSSTGFKRLLPMSSSQKSMKHSNVTISPLLKSSSSYLENTAVSHIGLNNKRKLEQVKVCSCFDRWQVCKICTRRRSQVAARAGTPGFRAPEVLLKYPHQTTAVDIWSAGVIMLCILSKRYPFFTASDDMISLAEMITLFGEKHVKAAAKKMGKSLICNPTPPPLNLRKVCQRLRRATENSRDKLADMPERTCNFCEQRFQDYSCVCLKASEKQMTAVGDLVFDEVPDSAYDLLEKLLKIEPSERISAADALAHPFMTS